MDFFCRRIRTSCALFGFFTRYTFILKDGGQGALRNTKFWPFLVDNTNFLQHDGNVKHICCECKTLTYNSEMIKLMGFLFNFSVTMVTKRVIFTFFEIKVKIKKLTFYAKMHLQCHIIP